VLPFVDHTNDYKALMFRHNPPYKLRRKYITATIFLVDRTHSSILGNCSPCELIYVKLLKKKTLAKFGCLAYTSIILTCIVMFDPRFIPYAFMELSFFSKLVHIFFYPLLDKYLEVCLGMVIRVQLNFTLYVLKHMSTIK